MEFCQECGKIIQNEKEKTACSCGFQRAIANIRISTVETISHLDVGKGISSGKNEFATFPHKCKKCGHDKSEVIDLGIWYSDESGTLLYLCGKCGFVEKEVQSNS
jgi:DNA-directed RNA polymerase subunit M/transcription elongation factor TFIIS